MILLSVDAFCKKYSVDRSQTSSLKWDNVAERFGKADLVPLWVADMDFKVPEEVQVAMIERIQHGIFGYSVVPDSYYEAYFAWEKEKYMVTAKKEWVRFSPGVVQSFYNMVHAFTKPKEAVIVLTPVYYPFFSAVSDSDRKLVRCALKNDQGDYRIDFDTFEAAIIENQVKLFIHCSPHNPVGRVWTKAELERLFKICKKHNVMIVSDEIHRDILQKGTDFYSALRMEDYYDQLIVLNAPSKTFNLACLLHSHIVIPDEKIRKQYDEYAKEYCKSEVSLMGIIATEACYRYGSEWLEGLSNVIDYNFHILQQTFAQKAPLIIMSEKQGSYLAWIDLNAYVEPKNLESFIQEKCGLAIDFGEWFGKQNKGFIRINLATKPENIEFAATQITQNITA